MSDKERIELGAAGRQHVLENYNYENFKDSWVDLMTNVHEKYGSWENRKNHVRWTTESF